jgi:hypothetical protein
MNHGGVDARWARGAAATTHVRVMLRNSKGFGCPTTPGQDNCRGAPARGPVGNSASSPAWVVAGHATREGTDLPAKLGNSSPMLTRKTYAHAMREEEMDLSFAAFGDGAKRLYPAPNENGADDELANPVERSRGMGPRLRLGPVR